MGYVGCMETQRLTIFREHPGYVKGFGFWEAPIPAQRDDIDGPQSSHTTCSATSSAHNTILYSLQPECLEASTLPVVRGALFSLFLRSA